MIVQSAAAAARGSSNAPPLHRPRLSRVLFLRRSEILPAQLVFASAFLFFCRRQKKRIRQNVQNK
jgi:hypothetical protein